MCYYATTDYLCGDWKWGNMMLRCPRQHRIGETCGAKLVHHESVTKSASICRVCEEISTKQRRLVKTRDNISRWGKEPDKFSASLEKAQREAQELGDKIDELHSRRPSVATNMGVGGVPTNGSRVGAAPAATATTLPPLSAMSSAATPGYEYTSNQGLNRRQESSSYTVPRNGMLPPVGPSGGMSLGPGSMATSYTATPAANFASSNITLRNGAPANVQYSQYTTRR